MTKLLPITLLSVVLAMLSHAFSEKDLRNHKYIYKERIFWGLLAIAMIVFASSRIHYNDTDTYIYAYQALSHSSLNFSSISWKIGDNPGFNLLNMVLAYCKVSSQLFLTIYAAITIGIYLWFIRKYTNNLWLSVFLFIVLGCFDFSMAAIKQCTAVAFSLVGVDRALQKKWILFVFWVGLGTLFHPYALMYLLTPFLMFPPWSIKTYCMLVVFALAGILLQPLIGSVVDITTMMGVEYDVAELSGNGVNPFRLAVVSVPAFLAFVERKHISAKGGKEHYLIINFAMLNAEIMFVALFGTANYFARLANYFLIFQSLALPWLFTHFDVRSRKLLIAAAVGCYFVYFYYANAISQVFDQEFFRITVSEYLKAIF